MNLKNLFVRLSTIVVLLTILSGSAFAADWFVNSTNGQDVTNNGLTANTAFKTIAKAVGVAADGDVIHVAAGTYTEALANSAKELSFTVYTYAGISTALVDGVSINDNVSITGSGVFRTSAGSNTLTLTSGTLTLASANLEMPDGALVTVVAGHTSSTPTYEGEVDVTYSPAAAFTTGAELPADLDGGTLQLTTAQTLTVASAFIADVLHNNNAGGTITLGANASVNNNINNLNVINLGTHTLTFEPAVAAPTFNTISNGTLVIDGNTAISTGAATLPDVVLPSSRTSTLTITAGVTVNDLTIQTATLGAFTSGAQTLTVLGDFVRENNTVGNFAAGTGTLLFDGAANATFNPGANLRLYNLEIAKDANIVVTMAASVEVNNDVTITTGELELGNYNITLLGSGATFDNSGNFYSTTGAGYIVFENTDDGSGVGTGGTTATILGGAGGVFGNILINLEDAADNVTVGADIDFSGLLFVNQGELIIGAGSTMTFTDDNIAHPTVKINTTAANTALVTATGDIVYDAETSLLYYGPDDYTAGDEWSEDPTNLFNVTDSTSGGSVLTTPTAATLAGKLYVAGDAEELALGGALTLTGDGIPHQVLGEVSGAAIIAQGNGSSVTGSADDDQVRSIAGLTVDLAAGETFTASGLVDVNGNISVVNGSATVTLVDDVTAPTNDAGVTGNVGVTAGALTLTVGDGGTVGGTLTLTAGALTTGGDIAVTGNTTLTAGTLTLGGDLVLGGTTSQAAANIVLGANNIEMNGVYTHSSTGTITGTGVVTADYDGNFTLTTDVTIPNFVVDGALAQDGDLTVSNTFTLNSGSVTLNSDTIRVTGNTFNYEAGSVLGTGLVLLNGTDVVVTSTADPNSADLTFGPTLQINATSVSFEAADGPVNFIAGGAFIQTAGNVALGDNNFQVNGVFTRTAGNWTMEDGFFIVNHAGPHAIGGNWAIDNLDIAVASDFADTTFTVNKVLRIANVLDVQDDNNLILADGVTVEITADAANVVESDASNAIINALGDVNLIYSTAAAITTGFETDIATINDVTVETATAVTLADDITVNGTLTLDGSGANGTVSLGANDLTLADGATLVLIDQIGTAAIITGGAGEFIPAGTLNLEYQALAAGLTTTDREFDADYTIGNVTLVGGNALTLHTSNTVTGLLSVKGAGSVNAAATSLELQGGLEFTSTGKIVGDAGSQLIAGGADTTTWKLNGNWAVDADLDVVINNSDADAITTVTGGNLDLATNNPDSNPLTLNNGLLNTAANVAIILPQGEVSNQPTQGFDRTADSTAGEASHIIGNVRKLIDKADEVARAVVIFPTGSEPSGDINGNYRPALFYFKNEPAISFNLTVNHNDVTPGGENGFPITTPGGLYLTNYSPFYWYVKSDYNVAPSYEFDVEFQSEGYTQYLEDQIENVRLVRRDSGSVNNQYRLQGTDANYDNATLAQDWPLVKVINATGGVTVQGSIFAYSQLNKEPVFTAALGNITVAEGDTVNFTFAADDPDLNQTATMSAVTLPDSSTFNASTGVFNWIVRYNQAGTHTLTIRATDGLVSADTTVTITVNNSNFAPAFANPMPDDTVAHTDSLVYDYNATDEDAQTVTFGLVSVTPALAGTATIVPATGVFTFKPTYADAGKVFTVTVLATDGVDTVFDVAAISVVNGALRGDADANGVVGTNDAVTILRGILNDTTFTTAIDTFRADASQNGAISAYDAYYVLYYVTHNAFPTLAKVAPASGEVKFGELRSTEAENIVSVPVRISNTSGVNSAMIELSINEQYAEYKGVSVNAEGWLSQASYANGTLRIALVGASELKDGDVAVVNLSLKNKEAKFEVNGNVTLNEDLAKTLAGSTVKLIPSQFALSQNYPNPFNPTTNMKYQLAADTKVSLVVYDMLGQKVASVVDGVQEAGYYTVQWNGTNDFGQRVSSGVYLYRLIAGDFVKTMKMNLLK